MVVTVARCDNKSKNSDLCFIYYYYYLCRAIFLSRINCDDETGFDNKENEIIFTLLACNFISDYL